MGEVIDLDCAFVHSDARVHAVRRTGGPARPLCATGSVQVHIDAPFEVDADLACARCASVALEQRAG